MDAWDFQVFAAVAKEGGMTRAAQSLHTVQSNVTKRIRLLEDELGATLFHRHKKGITLTTAGEQLLPYAEKIRQLLREAQGAVTNALSPRGPLRIGAIETTVALRLSPLFTRYGKRYPDVDLSIATDTTGALIADVLEYRIEGAFVAGPIEHPQLISLRLQGGTGDLRPRGHPRRFSIHQNKNAEGPGLSRRLFLPGKPREAFCSMGHGAGQISRV